MQLTFILPDKYPIWYYFNYVPWEVEQRQAWVHWKNEFLIHSRSTMFCFDEFQIGEENEWGWCIVIIIGVMIHVARRALTIYYENDAVFES